MSAEERRAQFKVILGGAHPQGRLSEDGRKRLEDLLKKLDSPDEHFRRAELLEDIYYKHGKRIQEDCKQFARACVCLEHDKHITFVEYQIEILNGLRPGEPDEELAMALYAPFMKLLQRTIQTGCDMYDRQVEIGDSLPGPAG